MTSFAEVLKQGTEEIGISLSDYQIKQFYRYYQLLVEWNQKFNLTAITGENEVISKHFIDSISILALPIKFERLELLDLGTGAGFPGLPLKIAEPSLKITLVDSLRKRTDFLKYVTKELELSNVEVFHGRAEEVGKNKLYRQNYDLVTSRAVARLAILFEYCLPFVKLGGKFIALKGPNSETELNESKKALELLGGEVDDVKQLILPVTGEQRTILIVQKIKETPEKYPRKAGMPEKRPL